MIKRSVIAAAALLALGAGLWAAGPIHLKTRDLTAASYSGPAALQTGSQGPGHLLLQYISQPGPADVAELEKRGVKVVAAVPDGGLAIAVSPGVSLAGLPIQWAGPLLPQDKISPLLSMMGGPASVVVEFHSDVAPQTDLALLRDENVPILRHPDLAPNHFLISATPLQILELSGDDEVDYIFPASQDLVQGNRVMACTEAMMSTGPVPQYVTVGSGWGGAGSDGVVQLAYVFEQMTDQLPAANTQSEILRAFEEWAKYANVTFVPGASATADRTIAIEFVTGNHGDGYPFTPGSGVLAHTFFPSPPNPEPLAGDMHLNDGQAWSIGSSYDVYTVALHEAGHSLGLGHTDDPADVMYPYYRFGATLSTNDIAGAQALYGSTGTTPSTPSALTLTIANPAASATTTASTIAVAGTASGGTGTLQVIWANSQGGSGPAAGSANWSIPALPLALGTNTIMVQVTDSSGNTATAQVSILRQAQPNPPVTPVVPVTPVTPVTPTGAPPSVSISSPGMTIVSTDASSITFGGTASAGVTSVTWTNSTGVSGTAAGTTTWTAEIPLLVGTNTIVVTATDGAGNTAWRAVTVVCN